MVRNISKMARSVLRVYARRTLRDELFGHCLVAQDGSNIANHFWFTLKAPTKAMMKVATLMPCEYRKQLLMVMFYADSEAPSEIVISNPACWWRRLGPPASTFPGTVSS